jgi:hypothetical protein
VSLAGLRFVAPACASSPRNLSDVAGVVTGGGNPTSLATQHGGHVCGDLRGRLGYGLNLLSLLIEQRFVHWTRK